MHRKFGRGALGSGIGARAPSGGWVYVITALRAHTNTCPAAQPSRALCCHTRHPMLRARTHTSRYSIISRTVPPHSAFHAPRSRAHIPLLNSLAHRAATLNVQHFALARTCPAVRFSRALCRHTQPPGAHALLSTPRVRPSNM